MIAAILGALSALATAWRSFMDWLVGERLRKLGQLEVTNEVSENTIESLKTAAEIDRRPVESDPDRLLDGLRPPDRR